MGEMERGERGRKSYRRKKERERERERERELRWDGGTRHVASSKWESFFKKKAKRKENGGDEISLHGIL